MKLAAIYNVWDGVELLKYSINSVKKDVDLIIIVYQTKSNFGETYDPIEEIRTALPGDHPPTLIQLYQPEYIGGAVNEIKKRNLGLRVAKAEGCTHFLHLDCDEIYEDFYSAKRLFIESGADGSVCKLFTYFKLPTLRFETEDGYYVPFIHKLHPETRAGEMHYPFWCDPTRRINCENVVELPIHMQHFSWVRKDIDRKFRNSSAKVNLEKGTMLKHYNDPECGPGFYVKDYEKKLVAVENKFGIVI